MVVGDLLGIGISAVVASVRRLGGDFDPEQVRALGARLRGALEGATLESPTFQRFPTGACTDACRFLSQYLFDQGVGDWGLVSARRKRPDDHDESHAWLAQGEWLLDITADQFDSELPQVILKLATESAWHRTWTRPSAPYVSRMDHYSASADCYRRDYARVLHLAD